VIGYGPSRIEAYGIGELSRSRPSIPVGDQALTGPFEAHTDCPLWSDLAGQNVRSVASDGCWGCLTGPGHWSLGSMLGGSIVDVPLSTSTVLATRDELFSTDEQLALAGFLAGYSGLTRDAYTLDLRQYVAWCTEHHLEVFGTRRADIECFARHLESLGRARATIARRLCTVACFYRYAEQEGMIAVSPAAHVRRPRLD
jgi:hypothetical protein